MAHYAFLDKNNIVTEVIPGKEDGEDDVDNWEQRYAEIRGQSCKRTSYNTREGVHLLGGTPFRKNYAGKGFMYDPIRDAFIPPKPYASWKLNEEKCVWEAPTPKPEDNGTHESPKLWMWDEITLTWVDIYNR